MFNRSFASMVQRLSHHPSIFGWVISNEIVWDSACLPPSPTLYTNGSSSNSYGNSNNKDSRKGSRKDSMNSNRKGSRNSMGRHGHGNSDSNDNSGSNAGATRDANRDISAVGAGASTSAVGGTGGGGVQCGPNCGAPCRPPQFVDLYRFANAFDPSRPCWFADGSFEVTTDPGLQCRNGKDSSNKFCFCDLMVGQSGWGHTTNGQ